MPENVGSISTGIAPHPEALSGRCVGGFGVGLVRKVMGGYPQAWLTDTLSRIAEHKNDRIDELLPRNYTG